MALLSVVFPPGVLPFFSPDVPAAVDRTTCELEYQITDVQTIYCRTASTG
jgi:hypothetical protein